MLIKKKRRRCHLVDFVVTTGHRVKINEREKINKNLDVAWELKKTTQNNPPEIPIVIGALGTVTKSLEKRLEKLETRERIVTIQTRAFLRPARILRRIPETWVDFLLLGLPWKTNKNLARSEIIIIIIIIIIMRDKKKVEETAQYWGLRLCNN